MQRPPSIEDSNSIGQMNGQATGRSLVQPLPGSHSGSIPGPHPGSYQNPHPGSHVPPSSHIPPHSSLQGSHNMPLPNQLPPTHQGPIQSGHNSMALPHSSPHPQPSGIPAPLSHGGQNRAPPTAYPSTHPVHAMKESNPNLSHNVPHIETGYNIQNQNIGQHSSNSPQTNGAQNPPMPTRGGSIDMIDPMRQEHSSYEVEFQKLKLEKSEFQSKFYEQLQEIDALKRALIDLESNFEQIKNQYEEKIRMLKRKHGDEDDDYALDGSHPNKKFKGEDVHGGYPPHSHMMSVNLMLNNPQGHPITQQHLMPPREPMYPQGMYQQKPMDSYHNHPYHSAPPLTQQSHPQGYMIPPQMSPKPTGGQWNKYTQQQMHTQQVGNGSSRVSPYLSRSSIPQNPSLQGLKHETHPMGHSMQPHHTGGLMHQQQIPSNQMGSMNQIGQMGQLSSPNQLASVSNTSNQSSQENMVREEGSDWVVVHTNFSNHSSKLSTNNLELKLVHNMEHDSVVCCVKFSEDGKYVASGSNKTAQIYDVTSGQKIRTFHCGPDSNKEDVYVRSVCFSPDGKWLATGTEDKMIKIWDIQTNDCLHTLQGHSMDIYSLDFSKDGRILVSGSGDGKAKVWDTVEGKCLYTLGSEDVEPKEGVTSVAISPDGRFIASGSLDCAVRLWDAHTGKYLETFRGHEDSVYSVSFSPDGQMLASGSLDKTLKLWDLSGGRGSHRCIETLSGHRDYVLSVCFSADGKWLVSGSKDRSVQFWDPRSSELRLMLQGHRNSVISVALSNNNTHFATGSGDFRMRLWQFVEKESTSDDSEQNTA